MGARKEGKRERTRDVVSVWLSVRLFRARLPLSSSVFNPDKLVYHSPKIPDKTDPSSRQKTPYKTQIPQ